MLVSDPPLSFETNVDYNSLKDLTIDCGLPRPSIGRKDKLNEHLMMLFQELSGQSLLLYYHNWLIVSLRRGYGVYDQFDKLWKNQPEYLLEHLSLRWLVSACDTIVDMSTSGEDRAIALCGSVLANTIKLYETERHFTPGSKEIPIEGLFYPQSLFDGMTTFAVGQGDMVKNLIDRCYYITKSKCPAAQIFGEIVKRTQTQKTIFGRFFALHKNEITKWKKD